MKNWFKSGNLILLGGAIMLLFIFSLFAGFMVQDLTLVTKDYYSEELRYDQKKAAITNASQIDRELTLRRSGDSLEIKIPERLSVRIKEGQVHFYCPSAEKGDRYIALAPNPTGTYLMFPILLPQCAYTVKLFFHTTEKEYYKEFKL
ncbi:MAG: FixH family protein [Saprospiraceae bacterium]|nr:FixH family protein [Saprospiraceae bacterium]